MGSDPVNQQTIAVNSLLAISIQGSGFESAIRYGSRSHLSRHYLQKLTSRHLFRQLASCVSRTELNFSSGSM